MFSEFFSSENEAFSTLDDSSVETKPISAVTNLSSSSSSRFKSQVCERPSWPLIESTFTGGEYNDKRFHCIVVQLPSGIEKNEMDVKVVNNGETVLLTFQFDQLMTDVSKIFRNEESMNTPAVVEFVIASDAFQADSPSHTMSIQLPFRCETNFVEQKRLNLKKNKSIFQMLKLVFEGVD